MSRLCAPATAPARSRTRFLVGSVLILILASTVLGCDRAENSSRPRPARQPTTTYSFSIRAGSLPNFLFMGRERRADLILRNDGFNAWRQARTFYFSPSWLGVRGDRVLEEGFRSPLPAGVEPGDEVALAVRVKAPSRFGLYRVHWDVLSDQSGRFARFDRTPEPARWVLVLPPVEFLLAVLVPCLLLGVGFLIGKPPFAAPVAVAAAAGLDLAWCALSLLGKPHVLYSELAPKFWPANELVSLSLLALLLLPLVFLPVGVRRIAAWCLAALGALVVWIQLIYFRFFLDLASSVVFFAGGQATDLGATIAFLSKPTDIWLALDLVLALPILAGLPRPRVRRPSRGRRAAAVALAVLALPFLVGGIQALATGRLQSRRNLQNLRATSSYGLYGFQLLDAGSRVVERVRRQPMTPEELEYVMDWFRETRIQRQASGPDAGLAEGLNLIAIQVESMEEFVVDFVVDGQPLMPNLQRLRAGAIEFPRMLDQTSRGRSSAGDFAALTSMIPIGESIAYEFPGNEYHALAHALADRGYRTLSAIPYKGSFWNRQMTHPAYGFETNLFRSDFERHGPKVGWGINDLDFFDQAVPILDDLEEPFFAWLTTLSVHYPYESFPDEFKSRNLGELEGTRLGNYLHGMNLFDRALQQLVEDLDERGLLDRTVIAIWGDHSSGLNRDAGFVDYFQLKTPAHRFLQRRVPFIVWLPPERSVRRVETAPAGQIDIAPTLLALLGVDPGDVGLMGRNLLGDSRPTRVVHPQGRWLDSGLVFLSQVEDQEGACLSVKTLRPLADKRCERGSADAERQLEVVSLVLRHDLQAEVSRRLARESAGAGR